MLRTLWPSSSKCDEPADYKSFRFRLGLFGLDKLRDVDRTVAYLEEALDKVLWPVLPRVFATLGSAVPAEAGRRLLPARIVQTLAMRSVAPRPMMTRGSVCPPQG